MREWLHHREAGVRSIVEGGLDSLSTEWREAVAIQSASVHVTAEQLAKLNEAINDLLTSFAREHRGQRVVGSRPVHLQYYAYPVLDGEEIADSDNPTVTKEV
jgi:hypothetical protein